jgi:selenocysteine-specific elongation factor
MRVIGTAGHVDHGKSTLVKRLTGIDPDRLAEEKAREMTIDLGFAWMALPDGEKIGFIDVPGHRDFIENMLAGIGGIDAVLLAIAADEGVMPQTREHLAILDLLGIEYGIIVLTKIDAVDDPDWLELIEQDIRSITSGTTLASAEIVRVSARTGTGISELIDRLSSLSVNMPPSVNSQHPRLPIDRVFSVSGFGTVVTGTLMDGSLQVGNEVELQPVGIRGRIRGLQSYNETVELVGPGRRVAVNIAGVDHSRVQRGYVLSRPGQLHPTTLIDVHFRHLADAARSLKHDSEVKFFVGAAEVTGHVRLLADELLPPGAEGWLQIRCEHPLAVARGDRFILRYPSPSETIGGGVVVNSHPPHRWKRFQADVIHNLETRMQGSPAERVEQSASHREPVNRFELQKQLGYSDHELDSAIQEALHSGLIVALSDGFFLSNKIYQQFIQQMISELRTYHHAHPLRIGMAREELRTRTGLKPTVFAMLLVSQTQIVIHTEYVRLAEHEIRFSANQEQRIQRLTSTMNEKPYTPPSFSEAVQLVGEDVLYALIDIGEIVQVQPEVIFTASIYQEMVETALALIDEKGSLATNEFRDRFETTRKYAIGLLEHLDALNITRRSGDGRVRGSKRN